MDVLPHYKQPFRRRAADPPHLEDIEGYENLSDPVEQIVFLQRALLKIKKADGCPCLYCKGETDNPLLVLEEAVNVRLEHVRTKWARVGDHVKLISASS